MSKPLVSIIIPTFNCEKYIENCINSVTSQTYKDIEIIIIDDGSSDFTVKALNNFKDKRIKLFTQSNKGVSYSRNRGISIATGEYITFVDADDFLEINAIELLVNNALTDNYDVVRGNYRLIKKDKIIEVGEKFDYSISDYYDIYNKIFVNSLPCYTPLLLIKRDFIIKNDIKFKEDIHMMEDTVFYVNIISLHPKFLLLSDITYNYIFNTSSASKSSNYYVRNMFEVVKVNKLIKLYLIDEKYNSKLLDTSVYSIISNYLFSIYSTTNKNEFIKNYELLINNVDFKEIENNAEYSKNINYFVGEMLLRKRLNKLLFLYYTIRKKLKKLLR